MKKFYFLLVAMLVSIVANASTVSFTNPNGWSTVNAYVWGGSVSGQKGWPGDAMTKSGDVWTITFNGTPDKIIFNNGGDSGKTGDLNFVDGATYDMGGVVGAEKPEFKVYYSNPSNWSDVYCYYWGGGASNSWPGDKMSKNADGYWEFTVKAGSAPANVIFNNGSGAKTGDLTWTDGKVYNGSTWVDYTTGGSSEPEVQYANLMGIGGDWSTGLAAEVTDNCATWTIENWAEGTGFKVKYNDTWYGYIGDVTSGEWYEMGDTGMDNTTLPASATGKTVTITFAVDTKNFSATWEVGSDPEPHYVYLMGINGDWENGIKAEVSTVDNCATWEFASWVEGTEFKVKDNGTWYGYTGTIENGGWHAMGDTGKINIKLPDGAIGKKVTITFAADNHNFSVTWSGVSAIENIEAVAGAARYFNLQGVEVANPVNGNVYIKVVDGKASKVLVK